MGRAGVGRHPDGQNGRSIPVKPGNMLQLESIPAPIRWYQYFDQTPTATGVQQGSRLAVASPNRRQR